MTTSISWWIPVAFLAAGLAGGVFRLGLVHSWAGLSGAILLAIPAFYAGWQGLGWPFENALAAAVGAPLLGAMIPEILREVAQGAGRLLRWLAPIAAGIVALGFALSAYGPDQVGGIAANLIVLAILAGAIRSMFRRPQRPNRH